MQIPLRCMQCVIYGEIKPCQKWIFTGFKVATHICYYLNNLVVV